MRRKKENVTLHTLGYPLFPTLPTGREKWLPRRSSWQSSQPRPTWNRCGSASPGPRCPPCPCLLCEERPALVLEQVWSLPDMSSTFWHRRTWQRQHKSHSGWCGLAAYSCSKAPSPGGCEDASLLCLRHVVGQGSALGGCALQLLWARAGCLLQPALRRAAWSALVRVLPSHHGNLWRASDAMLHGLEASRALALLPPTRSPIGMPVCGGCWRSPCSPWV